MDAVNHEPVPLDPFQDGWRREPVTREQLRNDLLLACGLLVGVILSLALYQITGIVSDPAPLWAGLIWAVVISLPLALRRRWPHVVAVIISAAFIIGQFIQVPEMQVGSISLFLALYSVGAWVDKRRVAMAVRVGIIFAMFAWLVIAMFIEVTKPDGFGGLSRVGAFSPLVAFILLQILTNLLYFGAAYYFGERAYSSARERAALEWRTRELEIERERTTVQAVALERLRIARELHDVVAHHVSVMGVQAGAGRMVLDSDPAAAREALSNVETSARTTIAELHRMLNTLREVDPDTTADGRDAGLVGVTHLPALVDQVRTAGLPVRMEVIGEPRGLPAVISLNLYRIAQEALTNARKHGGAHVSADVRLRYLADAVEIEITNDGAAPVTRTVIGRRPGGLGQLGMRERVAASHGSLEIGPRERGGYLVRARLPLADQDQLMGASRHG